MGKIDDNTISSLLARIESIKEGLSALENEIRALELSVQEAEPIAEPEPDLEPALEPAPKEEVPFDISISDIDMPIPPVVEPLVEDAVETSSGEEPVADDIIDDIPVDIPVPDPVGNTDPVEEPRKSILDSAVADTAVMDVMADKQAWRTDRPGMPVKNIISAISLNDRVLLINVLF